MSEDGSQDGVSIADAEPEPDEFVERVEFLQFAPAGRCIREGFALNEVRARKLFLLFPRMLLFRPARGGTVSKGHVMERVDLFSSGQWPN